MKQTSYTAEAGSQFSPAFNFSGVTTGLYLDSDGTIGIVVAGTRIGALAASGVASSVVNNIQVNSATAFTVAKAASTDYTLQVDTATASAVTGLKITGAAAAAGLALLVRSSGTNENLTVDAKGSGTISLNTVGTGNIVLGRATTGVSLAVTGAVLSSGAAGGIGYAVGAGSSATQATDKSTTVAFNSLCGAITMNNAALAADAIVSFTFTNTSIAITDVLVLNHISGGTVGSYVLNAQCGAGSAVINVANRSAGSLSDAVKIQFAVIKGVNT